ncbi:MAG: MBL fold metallo-hydrolase [Gemmatimonadetes bacterium]|nr:MBL fold metallo-hydrolase [Gemmatimonadota bacterium]
MRSWVLASGSKGNALVLESGGERLLVDCGLGTRTLARRLAIAGIAPQSIGALLLTHEHNDHTRGAAAAAAKWGWQVLASTGTLAAVRDLPSGCRLVLRHNATRALGAFEVTGIRVPHDAAEPMGFVVTARSGGARLGIATDLGEVPAPLLSAFERLDVLVLESNHDEGMLRAGPYPPYLKQRILARTGHLSNAACATALGSLVHARLRHVVLAHLSEVNNEPGLARRSATAALRRAGWRGVLHVAAQDAPTGPCGAPAAQLRLGLA